MDYLTSLPYKHTTWIKYTNIKKRWQWLDNFGFYLDEKSILDEQDIKWDYRDLVGECSDTESHTWYSLLGRISYNELLANEFSLYLREVKFGK